MYKVKYIHMYELDTEDDEYVQEDWFVMSNAM